MKKSLVVLFTIVMLVLVSNATASPWSQTFKEVGVGNFDQLDIFMEPGLVFFSGSSGYTTSGWATDVDTVDYISASGPETANMNFQLGFTDDSLFTLDFFAFLDGVIVDAATLEHIGNKQWNIENVRPLLSTATNLYQADLKRVGHSPVPEPATLLLFGAGLLGVASLGRKKTFLKK